MENNNDFKDITLDALAVMVDTGLTDIRQTMATKENLEERTLTPEEKEELLTMVRHYNKWLEDETLGERRITFTRAEYDATQKVAGFPHRFSS